mmetsp:Transcript_30873/g.68164  ORF Transcript_30873/g.68164 Transcript_30873/m.68164 type:complete len:405 (-) Transcript_30873:417-1631(-)
MRYIFAREQKFRYKGGRVVSLVGASSLRCVRHSSSRPFSSKLLSLRLLRFRSRPSGDCFSRIGSCRLSESLSECSGLGRGSRPECSARSSEEHARPVNSLRPLPPRLKEEGLEREPITCTTVVVQPLIIVGLDRDREDTELHIREGCWPLATVAASFSTSGLIDMLSSLAAGERDTGYRVSFIDICRSIHADSSENGMLAPSFSLSPPWKAEKSEERLDTFWSLECPPQTIKPNASTVFLAIAKSVAKAPMSSMREVSMLSVRSVMVLSSCCSMLSDRSMRGILSLTACRYWAEDLGARAPEVGEPERLRGERLRGLRGEIGELKGLDFAEFLGEMGEVGTSSSGVGAPGRALGQLSSYATVGDFWDRLRAGPSCKCKNRKIATNSRSRLVSSRFTSSADSLLM